MAKILKRCPCEESRWGKCAHPWVVRYREPGGRSGRQREKTIGTRKRDAEAWASRIENQKNEGTYLDPKRGRMTFEEYATEWMSAQVHKVTTADTYRRHLRNHINPVLGRQPLASLKPIQIQRWVKELTAKGLAASTVETVYNVFATIVNAAVLDDRIAKSPCRDIRLPEKTKTQIRLLTPAQVLSLANEIHPRYRAMILLAAGCGLRQGEALGLCLSRIDFLRRKLTVDRQVILPENSRPTLVDSPKTKASRRTIPVPRFALEALSEHVRKFPSEHEEGVLFLTGQGNLIRRDTFNETAWRTAVRKSGIPKDTTFHALRHPFVSAALAQGVPISDVSKWLGHASIPETVDTY